ncbi:MAG: LSm family protein [Thermoplasmatota archaeon]
MAIVQATLSKMKNQPVVVVTSDHRTFRGTLFEVDTDAIILDDAVEGTTTNTDQWAEVRMGEGVSQRVEGIHGTTIFQRPGGSHQYRLTRVMILLPNVYRIWQVAGARPVPKQEA